MQEWCKFRPDNLSFFRLWANVLKEQCFYFAFPALTYGQLSPGDVIYKSRPYDPSNRIKAAFWIPTTSAVQSLNVWFRNRPGMPSWYYAHMGTKKEKKSGIWKYEKGWLVQSLPSGIRLCTQECGLLFLWY